MNKAANLLFSAKLWFLAIWVFFLPVGYCNSGLGGNLPKVVFSDSNEFIPKAKFFPLKDLLYVRLIALEENKTKDVRDIIIVSLATSLTSDAEDIKLIETGKDTGIFENVQGVVIKPGNKMLGDGFLQVSPAQDVITLFYNFSGEKRALAAVDSGTAVNKIGISLDPNQTAGKPFDMQLSAQDVNGGPLANYNGAVSLEITPVLATEAKVNKLSLDKAVSFRQGSVNVSAAYSDIGQFKITARDLNNPEITGASEVISFMPAKFKVQAATSQIAGKEFEIEISALNYKDEPVSGYHGRLLIRLSDSQALFKENVQFSTGVAKIKFICNEWGEKKISVCDENYPGICGESSVIDFRVDRFEVEINKPSGGRKKFYFDEVFKGRVSALDYQGNKITGYAGAVVFKPVKDVDMPLDYYFEGERGFSISGVSEQPFKVEVCDIKFPEAKGESGTIELMPAKVKIELVKVKDGKAVLLLKIVDNKGEVIKEDNSTIFNVWLTESDADNSAFVAGSRKVKAEGGTAPVTIIDAQSETVVVTVNTQHFLETEPLDITF